MGNKHLAGLPYQEFKVSVAIKYQITNHKSQIPNKSQLPKFKIPMLSLKFRILDLFVIWCLEFLILVDSTVMKYRCVFVMGSIVYPAAAPVSGG
jgi:hypothetical protein